MGPGGAAEEGKGTGEEAGGDKQRQTPKEPGIQLGKRAGWEPGEDYARGEGDRGHLGNHWGQDGVRAESGRARTRVPNAALGAQCATADGEWEPAVNMLRADRGRRAY